MFRRCDGEAEAEETPIGWLPAPDDLDTTGLEMPAEDLAELLRVDGPAILLEMPQFEEHYAASATGSRRSWPTSSPR